jgi:hypothetical protein
MKEAWELTSSAAARASTAPESYMPLASTLGSDVALVATCCSMQDGTGHYRVLGIAVCWCQMMHGCICAGLAAPLPSQPSPDEMR